ncbi:MAG: AMP-binding protein [Acidiferrobacterales bacterium]|nr:AMP-binding protein [Acidiferrobacterales bacterium]
MSEYYDQKEIRSADERSASLTREILAQLQHAKTNAPAYQKLLENIELGDLSSLDDLEDLPVTRKSALIKLQQEAPPFGGFTAFKEGELAYTFISPGPIFDPQTHRRDYWRFARSLHAVGMRKGDLVHNTFSYHMTPAGAMFSSGCHAIGATVIPGGVGQTEQQVETIAALKPSGYSGTPSFLKILLEKADEMEADCSSIVRALVSGEAFPPAIRQGLNDRGIHALQAYATADLGMIAYESSADSGLILDEDVFVEIVKPGTGERLPIGEVGEVVVTTLNPDYPLIRFATGDMSAIMAGTSPCGRTNTRIKGWMGRADQTAKVRGMFVRPEQVAELLKRYPQIIRARLVIDWIDQTDKMTMHCEVESQDENLSDAIGVSIRDLFKVRGAVELVEKGSLPKDGVVIEDIRKYD